MKKPAKKGHNRTGGVAADKLRAVVERIEKLEEQKAALSSDIRDVYSEAKGNGFDVKTLSKIIRLRRQEANQREAEQDLLDTYMHALGMLPLFEQSEEKT